jgi:hypothetical protein
LLAATAANERAVLQLARPQLARETGGEQCCAKLAMVEAMAYNRVVFL